jgi:hypothetical protein
MKKKWTLAARAAFARKMKAARLAKRGGRTKNPKRRRRRVKNARVHRRRERANNPGRFAVQVRSGKHWRTTEILARVDQARRIARYYHAAHPSKAVRVYSV